MPFRKTTRRFVRRPIRRRRKIVRRLTKKLTIRRSPFVNIFPEKKFVNMLYADEFLLTPGGVGLGDFHVFRANSIFDPDLTGVGHQPRYHDTLQSIYERYVVVGSTINVRFWAPGSASAGQCMVYSVIRPTSSDTPSTSNSFGNLIEQGGIHFKPLGARDGGHDVTLTRSVYNPWKLYKKNPYNEDDLQALFGANPLTSPIFVMGVVPVNAGDTIGAVRCTITINYKVMCLRKKHDLGED